MKQQLLTPEDKKTAIHWMTNSGYMVQTIADHFKITVEQLKAEIHTGSK